MYAKRMVIVSWMLLDEINVNPVDLRNVYRSTWKKKVRLTLYNMNIVSNIIPDIKNTYPIQLPAPRI